MKKLAIASVFLVTLGAAGVASAAPTTLHLTERQTFQHYLDKGAKGESAGDVRTFGGPVFEHGRRIGHDRIRCVVQGPCSAQVWLAGGSIISQGFVVHGPDFSAPLTSGTGRYAGVEGSVKVMSGPTSHYTVTLDRL